MPAPLNPHGENPNTYIVHDSSNRDEMARLYLQDQLLTTSMGGALAEQPDPSSLQSILDIGCETGSWLIDVAKTYPNIPMLAGVDINGKTLDYARKQAAARGASDRIEFHVMDALGVLEFPTHTFDLVNQRYGMGFLRTWEWPDVLEQYQRVIRPGGVVRITEGEVVLESTSPALKQLNQLLLQAMCNAGHFFECQNDGVTSHLTRLLHQSGYQNIQTHPHTFVYRTGTKEGQDFYEIMRLAYRTASPFLRKWIRLPDTYDATYQQALSEMKQPDFTATWKLLTVWANTPE